MKRMPLGEEAVTYEIRAGFDLNKNPMLDADEAQQLEVYKNSSDGSPRYAMVRGISNAKYADHLDILEGKLHVLGQDQPGWPAKHARSFLALFYYKGEYSNLKPDVRPPSAGVDVILDAFSDGEGFAEWLTHNSGANFNEDGVATIKQYSWPNNSAVAEFFARRTPFALERIVNNTSGYFEYGTDTGTQLEAFYNSEIKAAAEAALASAEVGDSVVFPPASGWYLMPQDGAPTLFKSARLHHHQGMGYSTNHQKVYSHRGSFQLLNRRPV